MKSPSLPVAATQVLSNRCGKCTTMHKEPPVCFSSEKDEASVHVGSIRQFLKA
jgi:hypothetical protein